MCVSAPLPCPAQIGLDRLISCITRTFNTLHITVFHCCNFFFTDQIKSGLKVYTFLLLFFNRYATFHVNCLDTVERYLSFQQHSFLRLSLELLGNGTFNAVWSNSAMLQTITTKQSLDFLYRSFFWLFGWWLELLADYFSRATTTWSSSFLSVCLIELYLGMTQGNVWSWYDEKFQIQLCVWTVKLGNCCITSWNMKLECWSYERSCPGTSIYPEAIGILFFSLALKPLISFPPYTKFGSFFHRIDAPGLGMYFWHSDMPKFQ